MKLKKILVGAVVTSMIFTNSTIGFAAQSVDEDVFETLYNKLKVVMTGEPRANMSYVLSVLDDQQDDIKLIIKSDFENAKELTKVKAYAFNETNVKNILNEFINNKALFIQMSNDKNVEYSTYDDQLKTIVSEVYKNMPNDIKVDLAHYGDAEIVFQGLLSAVINDVVAEKTTNLDTGVVYGKTFELDNQTDIKMLNYLDTLNNTDNAKTLKVVQALYELVNFALDVNEEVLRGYSDENDEAFDKAFSLAETMGMVKSKTYDPPNGNDDDDDDKDSGSGSSGGSTGGSTKTPATGLDKDDQKKLDEVEDQLPQAGKDATDAQKEAAKDAVDQLLGGMTLDTAKDADAQVKAVASTVGKTLAVLDGEKAAEVAGEFADLVGAALENPNVSVEEQQEMLEGAIRNTFSKLVSNEAASAADLAGVKEEIAALAETVVKNAATLKVRAQSSDDLKAFELTAKDLASTLKKAVATQADFVKSLEANGLTDVAKTVEKNINLALPEVKATEQVSIKLDAEAAKSLGDSGVGVTVEAKGVNFKLPASLMQAAKSGLSVTSKPVTKADHLNQVTDAGKMTNLKTVNVSVENGEETVKGMVELAFSLADLKDVDLDALAVGVFEEGQWTKLDYTIENGMVTFTAPHFSIYSLMTFTPSFEDVDASWAKQYITSLTARGVVSGKSTTAYDPNGTLTRAEFTTMLVKHLGLTNEVTQNFKDVSSDEWYYTYVGQAGLNSLAVGIEAGNFMPNEPITREDMAVMMYRAYKLENGFNLDSATTPFSDNLKISESARDAVYAVRTHGIISGYPDNTFRPEANATRAEAAAMMYLFLNK